MPEPIDDHTDAGIARPDQVRADPVHEDTDNEDTDNEEGCAAYADAVWRVPKEPHGATTCRNGMLEERSESRHWRLSRSPASSSACCSPDDASARPIPPDAR